MAINAISHLENKIKVNNDKWLLYVLKQTWQDIDVYSSVQDTISRVYGTNKGIIDTTSQIADFQIKGLIAGNDFSGIDAYSASVLAEAFLYTTNVVIKNGDTIVQVRADSLSQRWKVEREQAIGIQENVIKKFKLSSLVD